MKSSKDMGPQNGLPKGNPFFDDKSRFMGIYFEKLLFMQGTERITDRVITKTKLSAIKR